MCGTKYHALNDIEARRADVISFKHNANKGTIKQF